MLQNLICCFRTKNVVPSVSKSNKKAEKVCVKITIDDTSRQLISLLETKSIYDSTDSLYKLDKPIEWQDTTPFVPPVDKGIVIKVYDGDTITIAS